MDKDLRYIVRIAGKDLNGELPIWRALQAIKGVGQRAARSMAIVFEKETGKSFETKLGKMDEQFDKTLEDIVTNPGKHGLPVWTFNRRKDFETGQDSHIIMSDLDFTLRKDLQRLNEIKSYRGLRLSWGLPVRGQRTKSTHRGKGSAVGVMKKDAKQGK
ncbi:MAG: 30S ribosomal protein S13 [Candidatus Diapherotrites archaeon]|uniref:30S ribosomal protein S13 n=1 Tax=Candidatus Iainarchaeum sp. TaxID=3101447 RepID=A0A2D6M0N1_9ARCH|nr:30S ribosomal protein S13 [Candidatus Diapherotrites archaeon]